MKDLVEKAKAILQARVDELNARLNGTTGPATAYFNTKSGGRVIYRTIAIGGPRMEGDSHDSLQSPIAAVAGFIEATGFLDDPELKGRLYWRRMPELAYMEERAPSRSDPDREWSPLFTTQVGWYVSARLAVSEEEPAEETF